MSRWSTNPYLFVTPDETIFEWDYVGKPNSAPKQVENGVFDGDKNVITFLRSHKERVRLNHIGLICFSLTDSKVTKYFLCTSRINLASATYEFVVRDDLPRVPSELTLMNAVNAALTDLKTSLTSSNDQILQTLKGASDSLTSLNDGLDLRDLKLMSAIDAGDSRILKAIEEKLGRSQGKQVSIIRPHDLILKYWKDCWQMERKARRCMWRDVSLRSEGGKLIPSGGAFTDGWWGTDMPQRITDQLDIVLGPDSEFSVFLAKNAFCFVDIGESKVNVLAVY